MRSANPNGFASTAPSLRTYSAFELVESERAIGKPRDRLRVVGFNGGRAQDPANGNAEGEYAFDPVTPKRERLTIGSLDDLYARLPIGAARLEGLFRRSGELVVDMTIVGQQRSTRGLVSRAELSGQCVGATHVLAGFTVGAFSPCSLCTERELWESCPNYPLEACNALKLGGEIGQCGHASR